MLFEMDRLEKNARVVALTEAGPLIEVTFKGRAWDGCGDELCRFMDQVFQDMGPAGVVMNLGEFKIESWDDIGPVFLQLIDKHTHKFRPFCIVARRRTTKSLKTLFMAMQVSEIVDPEFFDEAKDGLEYLKNRLKEARPDRSR